MNKELTRVVTLKMTLIGKYDDNVQEPVSKKELRDSILLKTGADDVEIIRIQDFERDIEVENNEEM